MKPSEWVENLADDIVDRVDLPYVPFLDHKVIIQNIILDHLLEGEFYLARRKEDKCGKLVD